MEPGEARLISSATLFATDIDTPSTELMYILKSVPSEGLLQLKVGVVKCPTRYSAPACPVLQKGGSCWPLVHPASASGFMQNFSRFCQSQEVLLVSEVDLDLVENQERKTTLMKETCFLITIVISRSKVDFNCGSVFNTKSIEVKVDGVLGELVQRTSTVIFTSQNTNKT